MEAPGLTLTPERLGLLLEGVPVGVYVYHLADPADDRSLRLVYANAASEQHTGVARSAIVGRLIDECFPGLREMRLPQLFAGVVRTGVAARYEELDYEDQRVRRAMFQGEARPLGDGLVGVYFENSSRKERLQIEAARADVLEKQAAERTALLEQLELANGRAQEALESYELLAGAAQEAFWDVVIDPAEPLHPLEPYRPSKRFAQLLGYEPEEFMFTTRTWEEIIHPDDFAHMRAAYARMIETRTPFQEEYRVRTRSGEERIWRGVAIGIFDHEGRPRRVAGTVRDITEERRAQKALEDRIALIERQRTLIERLSTPILRIWDGVIALPIIGAVDAERAAAMMDQLLAEVSARGVSFALLDLTGVEAIDTTTADQLLRIAGATRLLGAQAIITGIRPAVAQAMVALGVDLSAVETRSSLREGLRDCVRQMAQARG